MLQIVPKTETRFWSIFLCLLLPLAVVSFVLCLVMAIATAFGENTPVIDGREIRGVEGVLLCFAVFPLATLFFTLSFSCALYFDRLKMRRQRR